MGVHLMETESKALNDGGGPDKIIMLEENGSRCVDGSRAVVLWCWVLQSVLCLRNEIFGPIQDESRPLVIG